MEHITFVRFRDKRHAVAGLRAMRQYPGADPQIVAHLGATDAASLEHEVQQAGTFPETDLRHALVIGITAGLVAGSAFGALLASVGIFPGTVWQGAGFGALMGVLVGLLMMSILGTGLMDRRLQRVTRNLQPGEVVLTVRTTDRETCDQVNAALLGTGAQIAEKSPL